MSDPPLSLPYRSPKPRREGLTIVIDNGVPVGGFADAVESNTDYIDMVKFGWGTALVTKHLAAKTSILRQHGISYFFGGTLFEKFVTQHRLTDYLELCRQNQCPIVEVSNGTIPITNAEKASYIRRVAPDFVVFSEVGYKDQERSQTLDADQWVSYIHEDLGAGASHVIIEARESGKSGICCSDGKIRSEVVEHILDSEIPHASLIFEAPSKELQTFYVTRLGAEANLANIAFEDVLATETLRLGLRADTLLHFELERDHARGPRVRA